MIDTAAVSTITPIVSDQQALNFLKEYIDYSKQEGKLASFRKIAAKQNINPTSVWITIRANEKLHTLYERARKCAMEISADELASATISRADNAENAAIARNQIQARQWLASRYDQTTYGDKLQVDQRTVEVTVELPAFNPSK